MAATNFTPIQLYRTTTAAATPSAGNLADGELAINTTDEKLYFKNAGGTVKLLASTASVTGTVSSVDVSGGTTGLTFSGGPITTSGTITMAGTLDVDNGGTGTTTQFTAGSVVFAGTSGVYNQDNANLFWDDTNNRLGIGTATPAYKLHVVGDMRIATTTNASLFFGNASTVYQEIKYDDATGALAVGSLSPNNYPVLFQIGGTERMRLDVGGRLLVGTTATNDVAGNTGLVQVETANAASNISIVRNTANATPGYLVFGKSRGAALGGRTVVQADDGLGSLFFAGADGTNMVLGAIISAAVDGTPGTNDMPGRLVFSTTADGASSPTERMRISNAGGVSVGTTTDPGAGKILAAKGILPRVNAQTTTASPWAWNSDDYDQQSFSALANALTINADAGTPTDGQKTILRFKDNGTTRTLTFTGGASKAFRDLSGQLTVSGSNFTYATVVSKLVYFGCVYNGADARWDIVAVTQQP
jgi:sarcosine oxidase gamma subunit